MADDRELWERIRGRDAEAFDEFYRANARRLYAFLRQVVGNDQVAEDLAQETFTKMWQSPNGYDAERGSLRRYVFGVGRKRAAEWWRQQERAQRTAIQQHPPAALGETATTSASIGEALARLPEEPRALLWLREVEGQSYEELAEILEIPIGTVKSRLFKAREQLRILWQRNADQKREGT